MKTELSQHKLKEQTLACFVLLSSFVPPLTSAFNNLELVGVVEPTY
jgi:hypothetical protein